MKLIFFLILTSAHTSANDDYKQKWEKWRKSLAEIAKETEYAENNLPPCEALDRIAEIALKRNPAKICKKSLEIFEHFLKLERALRANCRDVYSFTDETFRKESYCASEPENRKKAMSSIEILNTKRNECIGTEEEQTRIENLLNDPDLRGQDEERMKGEFADPDCYAPIAIGLNMRKKMFTLANTHFGVVHSAIDQACENPTRMDQLFRYQREGEKALLE